MHSDRDDGWIDMTRLAIDRGLVLSAFLRTKSTRAFVEFLAHRIGRSPLDVRRGKGHDQQGTWGHPILARKFLVWGSHESEYECLQAWHEKTTDEPWWKAN